MATATKVVLSLKLKNILFATDFSPCSEAALLYARAIAGRFSSTIHVVHVLAPEPLREVPLNHVPALDKERQKAEQRMANFLVEHPLQGISHSVAVERGPLWHVLSDIIQEQDIDLIVLGTHGRRGLKKLVLGSVAEEIFRRARCPVVTVGPQAPVGVAEGRLERILYATDFSSGSLQAYSYALALARQHHSKLFLLHVLPEMSEASEEQTEAIAEDVRCRLQQLLTPAVGLWCEAQPVVLFGAPAEGILRLATEEKIELIVMGARRPTLALASAHLPWAIAHQVVCEAHCPVLTVRG